MGIAQLRSTGLSPVVLAATSPARSGCEAPKGVFRRNPGEVFETAPIATEKFAFLHVDVDLYEPTKDA